MEGIYRSSWFKVATYWVAGYFLFFILMWGLMSSGADLGLGWLVVFGIHLLTMLLAFVLMIFYVIHAAQNPFLDTGGKVMWLALLVLCGGFLMPVYYQRHLTRT